MDVYPTTSSTVRGPPLRSLKRHLTAHDGKAGTKKTEAVVAVRIRTSKRPFENRPQRSPNSRRNGRYHRMVSMQEPSWPMHGHVHLRQETMRAGVPLETCRRSRHNGSASSPTFLASSSNWPPITIAAEHRPWSRGRIALSAPPESWVHAQRERNSFLAARMSNKSRVNNVSAAVSLGSPKHLEQP